jgi:chromosome segregation ATPase
MLHRLFKKTEYADNGLQTDYDDTADRLAALQERYTKLKESHKRLEETQSKTQDKLYLTENKLK